MFALLFEQEVVDEQPCSFVTLLRRDKLREDANANVELPS